MSDKHRSRERRPRSISPKEEWRNVRVKEEPLSDVEGHNSRRYKNHHSSSSSRSSRDRDRDRDYHHHEREHGTRKPSRDRDHHYQSSSSRGSSNRYHQDDRRDRDHRDDRPSSRPKIKSEPRSSRSRSPGEFIKPAPSRRSHHNNRDDNERGHGSRHPPPQKDIKRERDWDNFFNPESDMSRQAVTKREQRDNTEKEQQLVEYDDDGNKKEENVEKEKPNFGLSGKLTEETNTYRGVVIKYSEPPEARKPLKTRWRLYPFKEGESLEVMYIHRQSAYLLGRERRIADIPIDHPSCSKQHAVIQYRLVPYEKPNGMKGRRIRPYIIDLESANGTLVNGKKIEAKRYVELFEKDVLKFGFSSREYVLLHDQSQDDDPSDDDGHDKSPSPE